MSGASNICYTCKRCSLVFQRYYELIRHQKNHCFKEENNKKSAKAQIAAAQIAQKCLGTAVNPNYETIENSIPPTYLNTSFMEEKQKNSTLMAAAISNDNFCLAKEQCSVAIDQRKINHVTNVEIVSKLENCEHIANVMQAPEFFSSVACFPENKIPDQTIPTYSEQNHRSKENCGKKNYNIFNIYCWC